MFTMISHKYNRLLFGFILLFPLITSAQDSDTDAFYWADTVTVEGVKNLYIPTLNAIATKMLIPLHSTPASVSVVSRALFQSQDGRTLQDALKNVSGINVQNGFGTHDFFLIRGFESLSGGLVLTDGAAEPEVSFYNLYNIDRVEVLKGPSAFLYGGNPLSGAANMIRKQPAFQNFASVGGSYGEFQSFRGTADVGVTNASQTFAFRVNGLWQDSQSYRDDKDNRTYAINPAVTWKIDDRSAVTLNFEYVNSDYQPDSGLPLQFNLTPTFEFDPTLPQVSRKRSYQTPLDDSDQNLYRVRLDYNRKISNLLSIRSKSYFTELDWQSNGTLLNGAFPDLTRPGEFTVSRIFQSLDDDQKLFGSQLEAVLSFSTASVKHSLLAGFEISRLADKFDLKIALPELNTNLNLDLLDPVETITDIAQLTRFDFAVGDGRSITVAPYFINQASFSDKFQLFLGGRFDVIDYEDDRVDFNPENPFGPIPSATSRNYEKFSPMAGMVYSPVPALSFYANAGQAFRAPSTLTSGEPKAEESTQYEVGAKLKTLGGRLSSTVSVYNLERENIAIPDQTGVTRQTGDQRSRGLEFELAFQPTQAWHAFLNYAFTDAELTEFREFDPFTNQIADYSDNATAFAPDHIVNFWTARQFRNGIGVGAGLRYVSSQFIDQDNVYEIDGYLTFNAMVSYSIRNLRWSVNVKNLTDKEYETRGFGASSVTPANPRAIFGSLDFTL